MSSTLAGWIARGEAAALARLVDRPGLFVREEDERVWVRAHLQGDELVRALARVDLAERFELEGGGTLVRSGGCVPRGRLETEGWTPLAEWVRAELPRARLAPRPGGGIGLKVVRGGRPRAAEAVALEWERFARWAETASALRLERLRFARSDDGRALVLGQPLPPLPGTRLIRDGALLLSCGFRLEPPVDAACAARALGLADGELALLHTGEGFEVVPERAFVSATRAAVRTTTAEAEG